MRVGLNDKWDNQKLENKWVTSSYEIHNIIVRVSHRVSLWLNYKEVGLGILNSLNLILPQTR